MVLITKTSDLEPSMSNSKIRKHSKHTFKVKNFIQILKHCTSMCMYIKAFVEIWTYHSCLFRDILLFLGFPLFLLAFATVQTYHYIIRVWNAFTNEW